MRTPDPATARRARWAVAAVFLVNGTAIGSWAPHIPLVQERLGLSPGTLGAALLAMAAGGLLAMPLTGALTGRWGSAPVTRLASLLFCVALPLPVLAPGLSSLILALLLFGAANGAVDVAMNAHGVAVEKRLGRPVMSSFHGMWSLGGLIGAAAGGPLLAVLPPPAHALIVAAALAVLALAVLPRLLPGRVDRGAAGTAFALPHRGTFLLGLLAFLVLMSEGAMLDWSAVHLRADLGTSPALAAMGFAAFSAAMAVGRFAGDRLRRRLGAVVLARAGALLAAAGLGLGLLLGTPFAAVAGFAAAGLGLANLVPVLFGAAGRIPDEMPARAIAAVATLGYAGFLAGPPLIGFVAEAATLAQALGLVVLACATVGLSAAAVRRADADLGAASAAYPKVEVTSSR